MTAPARSDWSAIAIIACVALAGVGSSTTIYAATPMYVRIFPDPKIIGWLSSIYFLVGAISAGLCGGIADLYGRRRTLLWVLAIIALGGVVGGAVSDPHYVVIAHAIQGVGIAGPTLSMGLIRERVSPARVPVAIAIVTTITTVTAPIFFLLAGFIMDHYSWRWTFLAGVLIIVPTIALVLAFLPDSRPSQTPPHVPWLNGSLFGLAALALLLGTGQINDSGLLAPSTLAGLLGGGVLFAAWAWHSHHTPVPMIDVRLLERKGVAVIIIVYGLLSLSMMQFGQIILFVGRAAPLGGYGAGLSGTQVAALLAPQSLLALIVGPLCGLAVLRFGHRAVFLSCLCAVTGPWLALLLFHHSATTLLITVLIAGVGGGALLPAFRIALQAEVPASRASSAMGLAELLRSLCMGIGAQLVAAALIARPGAAHGTSLDPVRFIWLIGGMLGAVVLAAAIYALFGSRARASLIPS